MQGGLVAFPTETVYGLGADAASRAAVAKIYEAKGRPSSHPVIVHIAKPEDMAAWCQDIPDQVWALARAFWPGPLTLILKRHVAVDASVSGGQDTIGVRCPSHPVAQALLIKFAELKAAAGQPRAGVAAPSANRFGRVSPTQADHVRTEFASMWPDGLLVLDGGDSEVGIESTIVDLSGVQNGLSPALLRPGAISLEALQSVLGCPVTGHTAQSPRVSGSLKAHYAPFTPLILCVEHKLEDCVRDWLDTHEGNVAVLLRSDRQLPLDRVHLIRMPMMPAAYARALYATLRRVDESGVSVVIAEQVPDEPDWMGVRDRMNRAAAAFEGNSSQT
ncbi:threonylcarbamoyl-AMP synthase [Orrella daihaiensis]|uniref:Threonylcarbamoyl-AMP synthase n=2 Tax=Orrella daihaiensis TaxID=2782176 RepID=A0ABY4AQA2_9BURK|nr:threonylcarbamoyl-AMP synthase [Orrella daihaiensis]